MDFWKIDQLRSGGVITNYNCVSSCRHCLYMCHPKRDKAYLSSRTAHSIFKNLRATGCKSVHIGGGEPMLNPEALKIVLEIARMAGVGIEYVETNAAWFKDAESARKLLNDLKQSGMNALLVSVSPFHNEYIPFSKTRGVMEAARDAGVRMIPWVADFIPLLSRLDDRQTHAIEGLLPYLGPKPLQEIRDRYWIHFGGRSLETYRSVMPKLSFEALTAQAHDTCLDELRDTRHFHIDLFGYYIPGLCSGLGIPMTSIGHPIDNQRYPILARLALGGVRALALWARERYGFLPRREGYINKCDLCDEIRTFLCQVEACRQYEELHPVEFYDRR